MLLIFYLLHSLCNACGLRYARSVAKQDSFGRRQRGVRVVVDNNQYERHPPAPPAVNPRSTSPVQSELSNDTQTKSRKDNAIKPEDGPEQTDNTGSSSMTKRRKKSRYLPIGDNRAGARTRAARKARTIHTDTPSQQLTHNWSKNL
jgi:hypothetical protein